MDIRTKLVFALVAVALGSMLALGLMSYPQARDLLRDSARRTLEGLVESKAADLENVTHAWRDRVGLLASRTQLRLVLDAYRQTHSEDGRMQIARIIEDAQQSVPTVLRITVFDLDGHAVAQAGAVTPQLPGDLELRRFREPRPITYDGLQVAGEDALEVAFLADLELDGRTIGAMQVTLSAQELIDVTGDHIGLGETGEVMIGYRSPGDSVTIINPLRNAPGGPLARRLPLSAVDDPLVQAVLGRGSADRLSVDYRGARVWAAMRFLPEVGWGIAVKFDEDEEERPIRELRDYMVTAALSLSAFAILIGTLLGLQFAKPIHRLAEVANRIRSGELSARADATSEDEIGLLARTFNLMADELTGQRKSHPPTDTPPRPEQPPDPHGDGV